MDSKVVIAILAGLVLLIGGYYILQRSNDAEEIMTERAEDVVVEDEMLPTESTSDDVIVEESLTNEMNEGEVEELRVELIPVNSSLYDQGGYAVLADSPEGLSVLVELNPLEGSESQPAHIHSGTCPGAGEVLYTLNPIESGVSSTLIPDLTLSELTNGDYVINVHKSAQEMSVYTSCGNID